MSIVELCNLLVERGIIVVRNGDRLQAKPADRLNEDLKLSLREHREHFLSVLPDQQQRRQKLLDKHVGWLNAAMPSGYRVADHQEFWCRYDQVIAERNGSLGTAIAVAERMVANHFAMNVRLGPGESLVLFPDDPLADFDWDDGERTSLGWWERLQEQEPEKAKWIHQEAMKGWGGDGDQYQPGMDYAKWVAAGVDRF